LFDNNKEEITKKICFGYNLAKWQEMVQQQTLEKQLGGTTGQEANSFPSSSFGFSAHYQLFVKNCVQGGEENLGFRSQSNDCATLTSAE